MKFLRLDSSTTVDSSNSQLLINRIAIRDNNLDMVKLVAAWMVIISHAYAFAYAYQNTDMLSKITDAKTDLGGLAVAIFFFYSGLLISKSLINNNDTKSFLKKRVKRIFPPFILVTLIIVFVAAPIITDIGVVNYFTSIDTYKYLLNLVCISVHNLPGVFTNNIYTSTVNGPIWTIRVEIVCYLICFIYSKLGLLKKKRVWILVSSYLVGLSVIFYIINMGYGNFSSIVIPVSMFFVGTIYGIYSDRIVINKAVFLISLILFAGCMILKYVYLADIAFLPIILIFLAFYTEKPEGKLNILNKIGASSYEIYLWGGFVGQALVYASGGLMNEYVNMIGTIVIATLLGYISNKVVKSRF